MSYPVLENDCVDSKKCWSAFCQLFPPPCGGQVQVITGGDIAALSLASVSPPIGSQGQLLYSSWVFGK